MARTINIPGFLGMNNVQDKARLRQPTRDNPYAEVAEIVNAEVTDTYSIRRRQGAGLVYPGTVHSLWSNGAEAYFVEGSNIMRLFRSAAGSYGATALRALVAPTMPMSYWQVNNVTVCSNGIDLFFLENGSDFDFQAPTENFKEKTLAGHIVALFKRRLYVAVGSVLYYTDADDLERMDERDDPFAFPSLITMVRPLENGIYVSAGATYWMAGNSPDEFTLRLVDEDPAIKGSDVNVDAGLLGLNGVTGNVAMWTTKSGIMLGLDEGTTENLTDGRLSYDVGTAGSATILERDGSNYYIVTI